MVRRVGNTVSYGTSRMAVGDDPRIGSWWGGPVEGDDLGIGGHDESLSLRPGDGPERGLTGVDDQPSLPLSRFTWAWASRRPTWYNSR